MRIAARRARRVAVAVWRFARLPKWLAVAFGACLVIPGPFDEMAMVLVISFVVAWQLRTHANRSRFRRYMRVAWTA